MQVADDVFEPDDRDGLFGVGEESIETGLFAEEAIPWDELAFASIKRTLRYYFADRKLGHFPVRHADQVVAKALVGNHKLSIKTNRLQGEGYHWDQLAERLRANGFALPLEELQRIAAAYPLIQHAADAPPPLGEPSDLPDITLRYPVARTSALARLDAFVLELCRDYRGRPTGAAR